MDEILKIANLIKHGKAFNYVKAALNVVFACGITAAIYVKAYSPLPKVDLTTWSNFFSYMLSGQFIVPFGIFFLVWLTTSFLGELWFNGLNFSISEKLRGKLVNFSFLHTFGKSAQAEEKDKVRALAEATKKDWIIVIYEHIRKSLPEAKQVQIKKAIELVKQDYASDFILLIRSFVATIIYYNQVEYFGGLLFTVLFLVQLISSFLLILAYQLAVLIPILGSKFDKEMEAYYRQQELLKH